MNLFQDFNFVYVWNLKPTQLRMMFRIFQAKYHVKNGNFLEQDKISLPTLQVSASLDNSKKCETAWGPLISLTIQTSAPRPHRRHPNHGHHHCFASHGFTAALLSFHRLWRL
jgi:hypothetical protein